MMPHTPCFLNLGLAIHGRFASKRVDEETELIYFGRRYYDPEIGRFVTCDPLGFADGPNRYLYGHANPLGMIDPTGLLAKGAGMGLKDLGVGIGQLFWNTGGRPRLWGGQHFRL